MLDPAASFQEHDQEFFERELAAFLPERVLDMHCHLWSRESNRAMTPPGVPGGRGLRRIPEAHRAGLSGAGGGRLDPADGGAAGPGHVAGAERMGVRHDRRPAPGSRGPS